MSSTAGLVVVGASLAGLRAVESARKSGYSGPITLIGAESQLPYDRPPLSKELLDAELEPADTTFRTEERLSAELDTRLMLGTAATALDPETKTVHLGQNSVRYESLIIATGVTARKLTGYEHHERVRTLRTVDDARAIRTAMDRGDRILIVGCGFIGSEVASALVKRGSDVTMVEWAAVPLVRAVGEETGEFFAELHRNHGVDLRLSCTIDALDEGPNGVIASLSDGSRIEADLVVLGLGANPATEWLDGSGLALEADGSVAADAYLRTNLSDVYAAGDVVTWDNALMGRRMRLEHWTSAAEQAAVAAKNAVAGSVPLAYETVPYYWSDLYGKSVQSVGVLGVDSLAFSTEDAHIVLHISGDVLVGALTVAQPRLTMKLRKIIARKGSLVEARELVEGAGFAAA